MTDEIERKFLIQDIPFEELQLAKPSSLMQGYLQLGEGKELRIRQSANHYYITAKYGSGLVRKEIEEEISQAVFNLLWPFTEGKRVEKLRFTFSYHNHHCDIDIYSGELTDLMVMEVEFPTENQAASFTPPAFCVKEITDDSRFKNASLAVYGKPAY